jgi:hypothetical protein
LRRRLLHPPAARAQGTQKIVVKPAGLILGRGGRERVPRGAARAVLSDGLAG